MHGLGRAVNRLPVFVELINDPLILQPAAGRFNADTFHTDRSLSNQVVPAGSFQGILRPKHAGGRVKSARAIEWSNTNGTEGDLIERCAAGDGQACQELVDGHQRMVYHLALQLLGNHDDALDLSQDVFLTVFRSIQRFRGDSALQTWIYRIVINQARNRQRWWRRRRRSDQISLDAMVAERGEPAGPIAATSPERALDQKELGQRLWRALGRLPFEQRSAVILREVHGMRYAEIGFSLGVTTAAVKSRLARARRTLRRELRPQ
jgi:RNA polymerase sigma-70 factor (ECF subfamily)